MLRQQRRGSRAELGRVQQRTRRSGKPCRAARALELRQDATAALNFYAPATGLFTGDAVALAVDFADAASDALRLSIRIAAADLLSANLKAAMERRTAINMACGVIIAQSRGPQEEAARHCHGDRHALLRHHWNDNPLRGLTTRQSRRTCHARKRIEGTTHIQAMLSPARRRLNYLRAMLRDGTTYTPVAAGPKAA